jgi:RES domain-containing protein
MAPQIIWRLTRKKFAGEAVTGEYACRSGGRFNSSRTRAVYASEGLALALVETLAGLTDYADLYRYVFFRGELAEADVKALSSEELPKDWDARPPTGATRQIDDA